MQFCNWEFKDNSILTNEVLSGLRRNGKSMNGRKWGKVINRWIWLVKSWSDRYYWFIYKWLSKIISRYWPKGLINLGSILSLLIVKCRILFKNWYYFINFTMKFPGESIGLKFIPSQCESFRTNPRNVLNLVWWKTVKNQSELILRYQSEWIRTNPEPSFQSRSIRINTRTEWSKPNFQSESIRIITTLDWFGLIRNENLVSDWFGFIWIDVSELIGLSRIDFWPFFIKRDQNVFRIGSEWFTLARIHISEYFWLIGNEFQSDTFARVVSSDLMKVWKP